jgi:hypothetical protein
MAFEDPRAFERRRLREIYKEKLELGETRWVTLRSIVILRLFTSCCRGESELKYRWGMSFRKCYFRYLISSKWFNLFAEYTKVLIDGVVDYSDNGPGRPGPIDNSMLSAEAESQIDPAMVCLSCQTINFSAPQIPSRKSNYLYKSPGGRSRLLYTSGGRL